MIFAIMLMDIVGLLVLAPVAPFIVRVYSNQALAVTMITVIYAAGQFVAAPFLGKLGDRYGRRPVLLISLVGQALGYLVFGWGGALWVLFLGRLLGGITGGNFSTATAYLADINGISSLFYIVKFNVDPAQVGSLMVVAGITIGIVTFVLVGRVVRRFGDKAVAVTSLAGLALAELGIFFAPILLLVYPANILTSAASGFVFPTLTSLNTSRVTHREVGQLMGVTTALASLTNIVAPLWAGVMFDRVMVGSPYWMGALLMGLAAFLLWRSR